MTPWETAQECNERYLRNYRWEVAYPLYIILASQYPQPAPKVETNTVLYVEAWNTASTSVICACPQIVVRALFRVLVQCRAWPFDQGENTLAGSSADKVQQVADPQTLRSHDRREFQQKSLPTGSLCSIAQGKGQFSTNWKNCEVDCGTPVAVQLGGHLPLVSPWLPVRQTRNVREVSRWLRPQRGLEGLGQTW